MKTLQKKRIEALDIMRGVTIAGMIMVNNPGSWGYVYAPLKHASWSGLTPTDMVFPFFMFIMGMTTFLSLQRYDFKPSKNTYRKIFTRTIGIIIVGTFISWFAHLCFSWPSNDLNLWEKFLASANVFPTIRLSGVLYRLAICYGIVAVLATLVKHKYFPGIIFVLFVIYFIILMVGNGYAYDETNILSIVDRAILTLPHMYNDNNIDPEGILSTIPSVAHVMIGFCVGKMILNRKNDAASQQSHEVLLYSKITKLLLFGACILIVGFLFSYACPINKKIWSPSFSMVTCGFGSLLLAVLIWIVDIKKKHVFGHFFEVFGVNPLFMFVLSDIFAILFACIHFSCGGDSYNIIGLVNHFVLNPVFGNYGGSCLYALLFVGLNWCVGYPLYKKNIYVKL